MNLYSFDLFDTIITRKTFSPKGVFLIMQEKLKNSTIIPISVSEDFADIRMESETFVNITKGAKTNIVDIYSDIAMRYSLNKFQTLYLMNMELDIEKKCTIPITSIIDKMKEYISQNNQVIIISDMYIPSKRLRSFLTEIDEVFSGIPIYVSCEWGHTKESGELYSLIKNIYNVDYKNWYHWGDNRHSDYLIPQALSINATLIYKRDLNNDNIYNSNYVDTDLKAEIIRGLNNSVYGYSDITFKGDSNCKNKKYELRIHKDDMYIFGYQFSGYILYSYVSWVLESAIKDNIEKIYFIARDGFVLKKIADLIIRSRQINIKTFYIYGSRKAWRIDGTETEKIELLQNYIENNVDFSSKIAFVDSNGTGESIESMSQYIAKWTSCIDVYYYNYFGNRRTNRCSYHSYCFQSGDLIEYLCSGTHGTTLGYKKALEVCPVLEEVEKIENIDEYVFGVLDLCKAILDFESAIMLKMNFRHYARNIMISKANTKGNSLKEKCKNILTPIQSKEVEKIKYSTINKTGAKKVLLYGAGIVGKRVFKDIYSRDEYLIIGWTDLDSEKQGNDIMDIIPLQEALQLDYDEIIISMGVKATKSARLILRENGVKDNCIVEVGEICNGKH